ncbi:MAG: hypothetical protein NVS3B5_15770 [Sphingomicrobium sp.]
MFLGVANWDWKESQISTALIWDAVGLATASDGLSLARSTHFD